MKILSETIRSYQKMVNNVGRSPNLRIFYPMGAKNSRKENSPTIGAGVGKRYTP